MPKNDKKVKAVPEFVYVQEFDLLEQGRATAYENEFELAQSEAIGGDYERVAIYKLERVVRVRTVVERS